MAQCKSKQDFLSSSAAAPTVVEDISCRNASFGEFSLCLSRACLGETIIFSIKWRKKTRFSAPDSSVRAVTA
eukprot:COSAG06_NODE_1859_length_8205_cov_15.172095_10_plen_72_part_00